MPTISQIITNGELSVPLSANYNDKRNFFGGSLFQPKLPILIAMVTDALTWMEEDGSFSDAEEALVANYLVWLCGKFGLEAAAMTGSGGSVTPIVPGGSSASRIDFVVDATSYIATGASSKTIGAFQGYELDFVRNGVSQSTVTSEPTYFTWTRATGAFTCSPALVAGEVISLIPV